MKDYSGGGVLRRILNKVKKKMGFSDDYGANHEDYSIEDDEDLCHLQQDLDDSDK